MVAVLKASARLLELLSLLQLKRDWTSGELAARLGVSARTIRDDVGNLRELGYPVDARPGVGGGYRLAPGTAMPPLLLDDDEAVAVAVGMRAVTVLGLVGVEETALTALAKLKQVLPSRLQRRVEAIDEATSIVSGADATTDATVLGAVAAAIRSSERLRFGYTSHDGVESLRSVEPHRLVNWGSRWYLLAWDLDRDDWRIFRVDRIVPRPPTGVRFRRRAIPEDAVVERVIGQVSQVAWQYRARILVHAPADVVAAKIPTAVDLEPVAADTCRLEVGSDDPDAFALWLTQLGVDLEVLEGVDLAAAFARLAARLSRAAGAAVGSGASRRLHRSP
jgi:predicted DNA-binding transcriptional regulator YafY